MKVIVVVFVVVVVVIIIFLVNLFAMIADCQVSLPYREFRKTLIKAKQRPVPPPPSPPPLCGTSPLFSGVIFNPGLW